LPEPVLKIKKSHKPVSRILFSRRIGSLCHLSGPGIPGSALPTPPASGFPELREPHINRVYMAFQPARFIHCPGRPEQSCALTARFHPYLPKEAVFFCDTFYAPNESETPPVRRCGALSCPDFPPLKATKRFVAWQRKGVLL